MQTERRAAPGIPAHRKDLETQGKYGVKYLKYWFDEATGRIYCLADAPDKEAAIRVHLEAHGLVPDDINEVTENVVASPPSPR